MALFIDPKRMHVYVPEECRKLPDTQKVKFHLRTLTAREYESRKNAIRGNEDIGELRLKVGDFTYETCRLGIADIEGPGAPKVERDEGGYIKPSVLDHLHPQLRVELANEIDRINHLGADALLE